MCDEKDLLTLARLHHKRQARGEGVTGLLSLDHFECFEGLARKKVCWMVGYRRRKFAQIKKRSSVERALAPRDN